jgi:hypothetical protein
VRFDLPLRSSVVSRQPEPLSPLEVKDLGSLANERIVNALMVNRRRLFPTESFVSIQDNRPQNAA